MIKFVQPAYIFKCTKSVQKLGRPTQPTRRCFKNQANKADSTWGHIGSVSNQDRREIVSQQKLQKQKPVNSSWQKSNLEKYGLRPSSASFTNLSGSKDPERGPKSRPGQGQARLRQPGLEKPGHEKQNQKRPTLEGSKIPPKPPRPKPPKSERKPPRPHRKQIKPIIPPKADEFGYYPKPVWDRKPREKKRKRKPYRNFRNPDAQRKLKLSQRRRRRRGKYKLRPSPFPMHFKRHRRLPSKVLEDRKTRIQKQRKRKRVGLKHRRALVARYVKFPLRRNRFRSRLTVAYKNPQLLRYFVLLNGSIMSRRKTQLTAKKQRKVTRTIKLARAYSFLAVLPLVD